VGKNDVELDHQYEQLSQTWKKKAETSFFIRRDQSYYPSPKIEALSLDLIPLSKESTSENWDLSVNANEFERADFMKNILQDFSNVYTENEIRTIEQMPLVSGYDINVMQIQSGKVSSMTVEIYRELLNFGYPLRQDCPTCNAKQSLCYTANKSDEQNTLHMCCYECGQTANQKVTKDSMKALELLFGLACGVRNYIFIFQQPSIKWQPIPFREKRESLHPVLDWERKHILAQNRVRNTVYDVGSTQIVSQRVFNEWYDLL